MWESAVWALILCLHVVRWWFQTEETQTQTFLNPVWPTSKNVGTVEASQNLVTCNSTVAQNHFKSLLIIVLIVIPLLGIHTFLFIYFSIVQFYNNSEWILCLWWFFLYLKGSYLKDLYGLGSAWCDSVSHICHCRFSFWVLSLRDWFEIRKVTFNFYILGVMSRSSHKKWSFICFWQFFPTILTYCTNSLISATFTFATC